MRSCKPSFVRWPDPRGTMRLVRRCRWIINPTYWLPGEAPHWGCFVGGHLIRRRERPVSSIIDQNEILIRGEA